MQNRKEFFEENGYYIEKGVFEIELMEEIATLFYDIFYTLSNKFNVPLSRQYPKVEDFKLENIKQLDYIMLDCFNHNKDIIGEGYDIVSYSSTFLRFLSDKKVESITKELLGIDNTSTIYGWTNRVRIDPPSDERRTYGWHQEVFYTLPESQYLQTWCPIIRDTTKENGTIWIAPKSNEEGIAKQSYNEIPGRATQIIVDETIVAKYENIQLEMKLGDLLFFDGKLFHKSGSNVTTDEIRFSLVGMWHNIKHSTFRGPKPNFQYRSELNAKEYWEECNKKFNWGY